MGAQLSASAKLGQNEFLRRFTGLEPISDNDPFWNQMLSFNWIRRKANSRIVVLTAKGETELNKLGVSF